MPRGKRTFQSSDELTPKPIKAKPLGALPTPDALKAMFKDLPNIEVLSRRFDNPNLPGSLAIVLKDESPHACTNSEHINRLKAGSVTCTSRDVDTGRVCGKPARLWYVRWFNLGKENRNSEMRQLGYQPVLISELPDANDISDLYRSTDDKFVRRGDRGQEVLAKQPLAAYNYIKAKQRQQWNEAAIKPKKVRESIAEAAGAEHGDEAGQSIHDGAIRLESFTRSTTTLGEESGVEIDG